MFHSSGTEFYCTSCMDYFYTFGAFLKIYILKLDRLSLYWEVEPRLFSSTEETQTDWIIILGEALKTITLSQVFLVLRKCVLWNNLWWSSLFKLSNKCILQMCQHFKILLSVLPYNHDLIFLNINLTFEIQNHYFYCSEGVKLLTDELFIND